MTISVEVQVPDARLYMKIPPAVVWESRAATILEEEGRDKG